MRDVRPSNDIHIVKDFDAQRVRYYQQSASPIDENGRCRPTSKIDGKPMVLIADLPMSADSRMIPHDIAEEMTKPL